MGVVGVMHMLDEGFEYPPRITLEQLIKNERSKTERLCRYAMAYLGNTIDREQFIAEIARAGYKDELIKRGWL